MGVCVRVCVCESGRAGELKLEIRPRIMSNRLHVPCVHEPCPIYECDSFLQAHVPNMDVTLSHIGHELLSHGT